MTAYARPTSALRRLAALARTRAAALGRSLFTLASLTAAPGCDAGASAEFEDYRDPIYADVYLHNSSGVDLELRVHYLGEDLTMSCVEMAADPSALANGPGFGAADKTLLEPGDTLPARDMDEKRDCHAALVQGFGERPLVLFWFDGQVPTDWVEGRIEDDGDHRAGAVLLLSDAGVWSVESLGAELVYPVEAE